MIAVVLGGAESLWDDVVALGELLDVRDCVVVAVNDAGVVWPHRLDHWATMHPEELEDREAKRLANGYPMGYSTWTRDYPWGLKERERMADHVLSSDMWGGSSGLLGVGAAWTAGARRIVLCGVPMDKRPHFNRGTVDNWVRAVENYKARWMERQADLSRWVRSMSGWTRETFGEPTQEWLHARNP